VTGRTLHSMQDGTRMAPCAALCWGLAARTLSHGSSPRIILPKMVSPEGSAGGSAPLFIVLGVSHPPESLDLNTLERTLVRNVCTGAFAQTAELNFVVATEAGPEASPCAGAGEKAVKVLTSANVGRARMLTKTHAAAPDRTLIVIPAPMQAGVGNSRSLRKQSFNFLTEASRLEAAGSNNASAVLQMRV